MFPCQVHQEKNTESVSASFSCFLCFWISVGRIMKGLTKSADSSPFEILPAIAHILKRRALVILQPCMNRGQASWTVSLGGKEGEEVLQSCTCTGRGYRGFISSLSHEGKAGWRSRILSVVKSLNPFAAALFSVPFIEHKELFKLWVPAT